MIFHRIQIKVPNPYLLNSFLGLQGPLRTLLVSVVVRAKIPSSSVPSFSSPLSHSTSPTHVHGEHILLADLPSPIWSSLIYANENTSTNITMMLTPYVELISANLL